VTNPSAHEYTASLRVFSDTLRLADLVAVLGEPTASHDVGDPVLAKHPEGPRRPHARWSLQSRVPRIRPLDEHIGELVAFVEHHRASIDSLRDQARIDIFCGVFTDDDAQGGFAFTSELIQRLADVDVDVTFDLY
jgi:hypothetical protein